MAYYKVVPNADRKTLGNYHIRCIGESRDPLYIEKLAERNCLVFDTPEQAKPKLGQLELEATRMDNRK